MNMISRDERKKLRGFKKFFHSFVYPIQGLKYAYTNEQNVAVDAGIALLVIIASFIFKVSLIEAAILALTIGLVVAFELINTSIEATVDLVTEEFHPLAKVAKDTSAAAVFIFSVSAFVVGLIIFLPKLINLLF